jgi:aminopeptidase N
MFPLAGNGGYDVTNYSLTLDYTPSGNRLVGTVVITARATQNLSSFDLDFRMHDVTRALVDGAAASFGYAKDQELVVTPAAGLVQGKSFTATVDYAGTPLVVTDPDQSIEGWVPTDDGAFVVNEPQGSPGWYPANDNPPVYYRGGITLQALREKIGDLAFFQLLRDWATQNRYGTVTTPQFIALAEKESGQDLTQFFKVWIYQAEQPAPGSW